MDAWSIRGNVEWQMVVEEKIGRVRFVYHAPLTSGLWADVTVDEPIDGTFEHVHRFVRRIYF